MKSLLSPRIATVRSALIAPQLSTRMVASNSSLSQHSSTSSRTYLTSSLSSSSFSSTHLSTTFASSLSLTSSFLPSSSSCLSLSPSLLVRQPVRHATKKAGGSVKNSSGSIGKHLGLKSSGGSLVHPGHILVRQRGLRTHPGRGVTMGRDETLTAARSGVVMFTYVLRPYRTKNKWRQYINVVDVAAGETKADVEAETRQLAEKYVQVLHMKRAGERVPTVKSVYLKRVAAEKREAQLREREQLIAKVTAAQQVSQGNHLESPQQ